MRMPDGEYAYFLTASAPFLPPCLHHRPGTLRGFDEKGDPCSNDMEHASPGCPNHAWFHGTTTDTSMVQSRRLDGHATCGVTTVDGFLADKQCWDNNKMSPFGVNLETMPWKHSK